MSKLRTCLLLASGITAATALGPAQSANNQRVATVHLENSPLSGGVLMARAIHSGAV